MEITISLPDKVFANVVNLASKTHRRVDEIIAEKVEREFSSETSELEKPLAGCSDAEVLGIANMKMSEAENRRMSELIDKQREEAITPFEKNESDASVSGVLVWNLRKAQGIYKAARRGLIKVLIMNRTFNTNVKAKKQPCFRAAARRPDIKLFLKTTRKAARYKARRRWFEISEGG